MADIINPAEVKALVNVHHVEEEDDGEEAMSLSDLPLLHHNSRLIEKQEDTDTTIPAVSIQEDFDFSCSLSKESDMCAADEVFFQGQIMPLRHSVSSEKGLSLQYCGSGSGRGSGRCISWLESMDRSSSTGLISSRSSSISSSHQSSSSGSSATTPSTPPPKHKLQKHPQNYFHSLPSPSPRVISFNRRGIISRSSAKKSSVWNIFRLGLVTSPPEIAFHDLRTRCPNTPSSGKNINNLGLRSASSSSLSKEAPDRRRKSFSLFGGCNCSIDAVETVNPRAVNMKKSGRERGTEAFQHEQEQIENGEASALKSQKQPVPKKNLSHVRTFEWLKQLSIEGGSADVT